jgi:hypothetical protein
MNVKLPAWSAERKPEAKSALLADGSRIVVRGTAQVEAVRHETIDGKVIDVVK